uniref:solute carrier family 23 member 2-like n=1 Tax=Epinephelus lanceolatus TaxID=310571 RepID=UPI0014468706|nr:solute carrier family 23 member 2-like [Epinephelus lanceolatus]
MRRGHMPCSITASLPPSSARAWVASHYCPVRRLLVAGAWRGPVRCGAGSLPGGGAGPPRLAPWHYILAFGGIIAIPLILAEPLCIKDNNVAKSQLISTIFFVSGISTLLQTAVGTRLPILQGGTFSFITPTLAILALPKWQCPAQKAPMMLSVQLQNSTSSLHVENSDEVWMSRMREIQGAILVSSLLQIVLGFSGLVGLVLKYIGPLAIAPTINLIGLSLFIEAGKKSGGHWGISALTVCLILLFSQYLSKVNVPMIAYKDKKWKVFQYPLFKLFSLYVIDFESISSLANSGAKEFHELSGLENLLLLSCI